jgi:hypothetical protein
MLYEKPEVEIVVIEHNIYMALSLNLGSNTEEDDDKDINIEF